MKLAAPSPLAALTVGAIHTAFHGQLSVETVVKHTLRTGGRTGVVADSDARAVLASVVFGTCILRARLAYMLAAVHRSEGPLPIWQAEGPPSGDAKRLSAAAQLLALFLIHERAQRVERAAIDTLLPVSSIGLSEATQRSLVALEPHRLRWPSSPVVRLALKHSVPCALARQWIGSLGVAGAEALAMACNAAGPVTLRANLGVVRDGNELIALLAAEDGGGLSARRGSLSPWAVTLEATQRSEWRGSVWSLPAWQLGAFEIQDEGSQLVAMACEPQPGDAILDLCAGNGGKALALAPLIGTSGHLLAHDVLANRLAALRASAARARVLPATIATVHTAADGDAAPLLQASAAAAPNGFDVILVDAPCSSSGTLRRHPGLRWSSQWAGGSAVALERRRWPRLQLRLLVEAAPLLSSAAPSRLVYATCSLSVEENEEVAERFERDEAYGRAGLQPWDFEEGTAGRHEAPGTHHRRTLYPHLHGTDGFFICRWRTATRSG